MSMVENSSVVVGGKVAPLCEQPDDEPAEPTSIFSAMNDDKNEADGGGLESDVSTITFEDSKNVLLRLVPKRKWAQWLCFLVIILVVLVSATIASICLAGYCYSQGMSLSRSSSRSMSPTVALSSPPPSSTPTIGLYGQMYPGIEVPMTDSFLSLDELYVAVDEYLATGAVSNYGPIAAWDVSRLTSLDRLFDSNRRNPLAMSFNADISGWNVSNVKSMESTFYGARQFVGDLSSWDTSKVVNMNETFAHATSFGGNIRSWKLSSVQAMSGMFRFAVNFNDDLRMWDVSRVADMSFMFQNAFSFDGIGLDRWDTGSVQTMESMFANAPKFNGDLSGWNVSQVTTLRQAFRKATTFNSDLSRWDTGRVVTMDSLFNYAVNFNADISGWNTSAVTTLARLFLGASGFLGEITEWDVSQCTDFTHTFAGARFVNEDYCSWGSLLEDSESIVTRGMFLVTGCPISGDPDNSSISSGPFCHSCSNVTGTSPPTGESVLVAPSGVKQPFTNTPELHEAVSAYLRNQGSPASELAITYGWPIGTWDVSALTDFHETFDTRREPLAWYFNENLSGWNTARATSMAYMFRGAERFDQSLVNFDTLLVTNMTSMFESALSFTGKGLHQWDTSSLQSMERMFEGALSFEALISNWKTGNVTSMARAFQFTSTFNDDISMWDVSNVESFFHTFSGTTAFNRDISHWNIASATNLDGMLSGAKNFNKNLCRWKFILLSTAETMGMFSGSGCLVASDPILDGALWKGPFCRFCEIMG